MTTITDIQPLIKTAATATPKNSVRKTSKTQVDLSDTASLLTEAEELAMSSPDIDESRIEEIRQAIEKGELTIDYDRLAQKMLEFELSLFDE